MKCLDCHLSMQSHNVNGRTDWNCKQCSSHYISLNLLKGIVSEYEFNKLDSEIKIGNIKSSVTCPSCNKIMVKILDFVKFNEIEACSHCKMVWLNAGELEKLGLDQKTIYEKKQTVQMPSQFERPLNIQLGANDGYELGSYSFSRVFKTVINNTFLSQVSNQHPILGFIMGVIIISIFFVIFIYAFRFFRIIDFMMIINR